MQQVRPTTYPTILQAIHLIILYIFIQTLVDFPLAMIDYYKDSEFLYHPVKKIVLGIGSTLFILWYGYKNTGNSLRDVFPLKKFNPVLILLTLTFLAGVQQLLNVVNFWVDNVIPPPQWFWELFNKIFENDFGFWGAFLKVVIIAPVVEELIFRGVIMHGLMRNYSQFKAIFFSGLLFALFHLNPWQFPATFMLGMLLGWLMIKTRNIGFAIIGHAINNLLVLLSITYHDKLEEALFSAVPETTLNVAAALLAAGSLLAMIWLCSKKSST
jgi:uncharacterized protein